MLIDWQHVPERLSIAVSLAVEVAQLFNEALGVFFEILFAPDKWNNRRAHCCDGVDIGCRNQHLPREVGFSRKMIRRGGAGGVRGGQMVGNGTLLRTGEWVGPRRMGPGARGKENMKWATCSSL